MIVDRNYQNAVVEKWSKLLDAGEGIQSEEVRINTALVLENAQTDHDRKLMTEGLGMNASSGGAFGAHDFGATTDSRIPTIVIPMLRRIFPALIGHEICGVQPLNGPVGFAFGLRANMGKNGRFTAQAAPAAAEIGYNNMDATFTGTSGDISGINSDMWAAFSGSGTSRYGGTTDFNAKGAELSASEWAELGTDMPEANFELKKAVVEAKTRKLGASWPRELAEDMMNMHGIDADAEMVNILSYEIQAEIDRQLIAEMVKAAIEKGRTSTWSPVSADGRNQLERIGTLYTQLLEKSNDIAGFTRRGAGNFVIASPKITAILQRASRTVSVNAGGTGIPNVTAGTGSVERVGRLGDAHALYRDTFAGGDYLLIGYKGQVSYDSGVIYCPYIPLQIMRTTGQNDFNPRMGVRTRDGIIGSDGGRPDGFFAGDYYQFIRVTGMTSALIGDDGSVGGRVFTYA